MGKILLSEYVSMNPTERLPKGTFAKKIPMDYLRAYSRRIDSFARETYAGGAKFRNGDTVMARITPCLENGKTAYVNCLNDNEIGFGSTEYIVMRAIAGKSLPLFVYYLAISKLVRQPAIKSMVGSSGRQRVQQSALNDLTIPIFSLSDQQHIVDTRKNIFLEMLYVA